MHYFSRITAIVFVCWMFFSISLAFADGSNETNSNDNEITNNALEAGEAVKCCGGKYKENWAVYRLVDGQVLDYRPISFAKPNVVTARIHSNFIDVPLTVIIVAFGNDIGPENIPELDPEQTWYQAKIDNVGYIAASQVTAGETWVFKIGDTYIEKQFPINPDEYVLKWKLFDVNGISINESNFICTNVFSFSKRCKDLNGNPVCNIMYHGSSVSEAELSKDWMKLDWKGVGLPKEYGEFYLLNDGIVDHGTISIGDYEYFFEMNTLH